MDQQKKTLCIAGSMILPIAIGQPAVIMERDGGYRQESQRKAEKTYFPKSGQKLRHDILQTESVYARMAWILRNSGNEERYGKVERVASQKDTNVHLEAVEIAENEGGEPKEIRNARVDGIPKRQYS